MPYNQSIYLSKGTSTYTSTAKNYDAAFPYSIKLRWGYTGSEPSQNKVARKRQPKFGTQNVEVAYVQLITQSIDDKENQFLPQAISLWVNSSPKGCIS